MKEQLEILKQLVVFQTALFDIIQRYQSLINSTVDSLIKGEVVDTQRLHKATSDLNKSSQELFAAVEAAKQV